MINSITLIEGTAEFSTEQERRLKNRLIKLLRKNGHNKFADRLENFSVKITALNDPKYKTAAISFDQGIIYINEGFLTDTRTFNQLDMLMRHELAHNLMMHQIRMTNYFEQKYGKEMGNSLINSVSVNDLLNIIMDDEISNTRYTAKDKELVRNLRWNNEIISGLVTEDHRIN